GAFMGVYLFPQISNAFGLAGALNFAAGMALVGTWLTLVLPEPARRSLEDISDEARGRGEVQRLVPVEVHAEVACAAPVSAPRLTSRDRAASDPGCGLTRSGFGCAGDPR